MTQRTPTPTWRSVPVRVDGRRMRVELMEAGLGDPLVFLHGWGLTPRAYAASIVRLCPAGIRIIAPSLPGFGGSDPLPLRRLGLSGYARHVAATLEAAGLDKPAFLVGHSFGGGVALALATERPDLVRSLTLLNSIGGSPGRRGLKAGSWLGWALGALTELNPRDALSLAPLVLRDFLPNALRRPVSVGLTGLVAMTSGLAAEATALVDSGLPILFIWSDRDRLVAPGALASVIGSLPTEIVQGRHGWLMASPEQFAELLRNALTVHAMLERRNRGQALVLPRGAALADLFPAERRRRARPRRAPRQ